MIKNKKRVSHMTEIDYESIKVVVNSKEDPRLKQELDDYNHRNKKNKINMSDISRKALRKELNERMKTQCR